MANETFVVAAGRATALEPVKSGAIKAWAEQRVDFARRPLRVRFRGRPRRGLGGRMGKHNGLLAGV